MVRYSARVALASKEIPLNQVARLAIPAFFTLIAEPLFLLADSAIIGHVGTTELAALGVASTLLLTMTGIFVFLAYATTAVVARAQGAGHHDEAMQAGLDGIWLAFLLGAPLAVITYVSAHPLAVALGGDDLADAAAHYLRVSSLGLPAMLISLAAQGLLRGLQDTKTPLIATTVSFSLNTALNALFVLGFGWGLGGSALGTVIAQWLLTALMLVAIWRRAGRLRLRPHLGRVLASAQMGAPLLVRTLALRAVLLLTAAAAAKFGPATMAAHQIVMTVFSFLSFALDALAIAAQAMTGEALGRRDVPQVTEMTRRFVRLGWQWGTVAAVLLAVSSPLLPVLFTADGHVRSLTMVGLIVMALIQPIAGVVFVLDGVFMGAGDGTYLAKAQLLVLAAYLPLIGVLFATHTRIATLHSVAAIVVLWLVYDIYLMMRAVTLQRRRHTSAWMHLRS